MSLGEFSTDEEDLVFCEVVAGVLACEAIHLSATPALVSCDGGVWGTSTLPSIPYPDCIPPPLPAPIQRHHTKAQTQPPRARAMCTQASTTQSTQHTRAQSGSALGAKGPRNLKFVSKRPHTRNGQGTPSPHLHPTHKARQSTTRAQKCHFTVRKRPTQPSNKSKNKWQAPSTQVPINF